MLYIVIFRTADEFDFASTEMFVPESAPSVTEAARRSLAAITDRPVASVTVAAVLDAEIATEADVKAALRAAALAF